MNVSSSSTVDFPVWEARWKALEVCIGSYIHRLELYLQTSQQPNPNTDPTIGILKTMLVRLKNFAQCQFDDFFLDGFWKHTKYNLAESGEYPPDYVLGITLRQIAYDLEVIQRAAEQRMWNAKDIKGTLEIADKLARKAIEVAYNAPCNAIQGIKPIVITYFEKSHSVRVSPYDHVALIAVPFTCVPYDVTSGDQSSKERADRDFVALLHELGHYVFWHGKVNDTFIHESLGERLKGMKDSAMWCYQWIEEIFADVFGCLMGGPLIALDFQDMALVTSAEEFAKDDQEHPVPAIRPMIYIKTLEKTTKWKATSALLDTYWNDRKNSRRASVHKQTTSPKKNEQTKSNFRDAVFRDAIYYKYVISGNVIPEIERVRDAILSTLKIENTPDCISLTWSADTLSVGTELGRLPEILYGDFRKYIAETLPSEHEDPKPPKPSPEEYTCATWEQWVTDNKFLEEEFPINPNTPISSGEGESEKQGWLNVLYAGGWTTEITTGNPRVKSKPVEIEIG